MKYLLVLVLGVVIGAGVVCWWPKKQIVEKPKEYPLLKYTIENLGKREYDSQIILDDEVEEGVYKFHFDSDGKNVTGLAHIPEGCGRCPVIAQFRGYAEVGGYESGYGTRHSAEAFAKAGFISLAPDFLGYGESASPSANIFEARFETYTTALNLLSGIEKWEKTKSIGVWGHSNGGQIALTVLEISQKEYPTVVWASVSAPFPYSILYYTDDGDKLLRRELAKFEEDYDADLFSLTNYLDRITAPVLVQQGSADESVPQKWSDNLYKKIQDSRSNIQYVVYPGADHNLMPSWSEAVKKDIEFFEENL
ncbi:MAG: peptidase [Microgenomates group bacterium Gr01-1014_16]|nr:MAG: peptidase [Microgenomates group bacterium Gr01-1014_16]